MVVSISFQPQFPVLTLTMGDNTPRTLDLGEYDPSPLALNALSYDVLRQICHHLVPSDDNAPNGVGNLSKVNRYLRDVSIPELFKVVTVRGDWKYGLQRLDEIKECPSLSRYTKYVPFHPSDFMRSRSERFTECENT